MTSGAAFDICDSRHVYEPCPKCKAGSGMGLAARACQLFVRCTCGHEGPPVETPGAGQYDTWPVPWHERDRLAFQAWNAASRAALAGPPLPRGDAAVPTAALKALIVAAWNGSVDAAAPGARYLAGVERKNGRGIYVVDGVFDRATFKEALAEGRAGGASGVRMYVFCRRATYTGPEIDITLLDDVAGAAAHQHPAAETAGTCLP